MTLNVKLIYRTRNRRWQSRITRDERDLLAESSEDLSVSLRYYFYVVDSDILEAIRSAGRARERGEKKDEKNNYLNSRLWQVDLEGNLFSHKDVRISRFRE